MDYYSITWLAVGEATDSSVSLVEFDITEAAWGNQAVFNFSESLYSHSSLLHLYVREHLDNHNVQKLA